MSFSFGISDFIVCGELAYELYIELKRAPGECQAFAKELLLLHQIILKTETSVIRAHGRLDSADRATLGLCVDSCKDIMLVQMAGVDTTFIDFDRGLGETSQIVRHRGILSVTALPPKTDDLMCRVRARFEQRSFAKTIPFIRSAISAVIEKLTSFQVLLIQ